GCEMQESTRRRLLRCLPAFGGVLFLTVLLSPVARGQSTYTAQLTGVVTDASEAVVPGVKVTLTDCRSGKYDHRQSWHLRLYGNPAKYVHDSSRRGEYGAARTQGRDAGGQPAGDTELYLKARKCFRIRYSDGAGAVARYGQCC